MPFLRHSASCCLDRNAGYQGKQNRLPSRFLAEVPEVYTNSGGVGLQVFIGTGCCSGETWTMNLTTGESGVHHPHDGSLPSEKPTVPESIANLTRMREIFIELKAPYEIDRYLRNAIELLGANGDPDGIKLAADHLQILRQRSIDSAAPSVQVAYNAQESRDILVDLFQNSTWIGKGRVTVPAGNGLVKVTFELTTPIDLSSLGYLDIKGKLLPVGADYTKALSEASLLVN